jgi:hypothetical protein
MRPYMLTLSSETSIRWASGRRANEKGEKQKKGRKKGEGRKKQATANSNRARVMDKTHLDFYVSVVGGDFGFGNRWNQEYGRL